MKTKTNVAIENKNLVIEVINPDSDESVKAETVSLTCNIADDTPFHEFLLDLGINPKDLKAKELYGYRSEMAVNEDEKPSIKGRVTDNKLKNMEGVYCLVEIDNRDTTMKVYSNGYYYYREGSRWTVGHVRDCFNLRYKGFDRHKWESRYGHKQVIGLDDLKKMSWRVVLTVKAGQQIDENLFDCSFGAGSFWKELAEDDDAQKALKILICEAYIAASRNAADIIAEEEVIQEFLDSLTLKQRAVLEGLRCGKPQAEIAKELGITQQTVSDHLKAIQAKALKSNLDTSTVIG